MKLSGLAWRGLIWTVVGVALHVAGLLMGRPFVMRWTGWPWGIIVAAIGIVIVAVDLLWLAKRRALRQRDDHDRRKDPDET